MKALIAGFEVIFAGPHDNQDLPEGTIESIATLLETEGYSIGVKRLSYLFDMHLDGRRRKIQETRIETALDELVGGVLEDLEIDEPGLVSPMVEAVALARTRHYSMADGSLEFLESLREAKMKVGIVCNSPLGIPPEYIRGLIEREGMSELLDDVQFSSENGVVRPHARPYRYCVSNMDTPSCETAVFTGLSSEMEILERLGFGSVFVPEQAVRQGDLPVVGIHVMSEISRYL